MPFNSITMSYSMKDEIIYRRNRKGGSNYERRSSKYDIRIEITYRWIIKQGFNYNVRAKTIHKWVRQELVSNDEG